MGYTRRKIRGIDFSFLLAAFVFACWALVCAWYGWPRGIRHGSTAALILFALAALFFCAFPAIWARYPTKHPVNHELARYGKIAEVSQRLDREMTGPVAALGPFRFTASFLIYDSGMEFQMIPYDQIVSAEISPSDDAPSVTVKTRAGRRYQWYRAWSQGIFDPPQVLAQIRAAAHLEDPAAASTSGPSTSGPSRASQSL